MKIAIAILITCLATITATEAEAQNGRGFRNGVQNRNSYCPRVDPTVSLQKLSADEAARLLLMREEEKLAMDIYHALSQRYRLRVFGNIAASESRHFDALGSLIARYELSDPALPSQGSFTNPKLGWLYSDLLAKGERSLVDALQVGMMIEEMDIEDLENAITATDNKDLSMVYSNLLHGSQNHLAAFNSRLQSSGGN